MKYFPPELYQQFNSLDDDEAERADEAWDKAEIAYKERLANIRPQMPSQVAELSEICLHDAIVVSRVEQAKDVAIVSVAIGPEVVSLFYTLCDPAITKEAPEDWRLSKLQEQWLYDEVDLAGESGGPFVHRILFSTGVTMEIPFASVIIHRFTVPVVVKRAKQSA